METIKFIHYTDVHVQENNPQSRKGSYLDDILAKLHKIGAYAKKYEADFTVCGGDLFNIKRPDHNTHRMVYRVIGALNSMGENNFIVPGNHDIRFDREATLSEQPLGVLIESGVLRLLRDETWRKAGLSVNYRAYPFEEEPDFSTMVLDKKECDVNILGLHIYATPKGGDMFGTKLHSYEEVSNTGHDIYTFGHYHKDQGVQELEHRGFKQTFVNVGSVSRGDYGDENVNRVPKCCLVTISKDDDGNITQEFKELELEAKPAEDVFDLDKKERKVKQEEEASKFAAELEKAAKEKDGGDASIDGELQSLDINEAVKTRTKEYLARAHELSKGSKL